MVEERRLRIKIYRRVQRKSNFREAAILNTLHSTTMDAYEKEKENQS